MAHRGLRALVLVLDLFVGVTAAGGGLMLVAGRLELPPGLLAQTPFTSPLGPGLLLALVVGGGHLAAAMLVRTRSFGGASALAGSALAGWIAVQLEMIGLAMPLLQLGCFATAIATVVLALWLYALEHPEPSAQPR